MLKNIVELGEPWKEATTPFLLMCGSGHKMQTLLPRKPQTLVGVCYAKL